MSRGCAPGAGWRPGTVKLHQLAIPRFLGFPVWRLWAPGELNANTRDDIVAWFGTVDETGHAVAKLKASSLRSLLRFLFATGPDRPEPGPLRPEHRPAPITPLRSSISRMKGLIAYWAAAAATVGFSTSAARRIFSGWSAAKISAAISFPPLRDRPPPEFGEDLAARHLAGILGPGIAQSRHHLVGRVVHGERIPMPRCLDIEALAAPGRRPDDDGVAHGHRLR